jgi:hypothetical protein
VKPAAAVSPTRAVVILAACLAVTVTALDAAPPPAKAGARVAAASSRSTVVMGSAWGPNNTPIPGARLQLRNVVNGKIVARAIADDAGRFAFANLEGGTYVVEMINDAGKIVSIGHAFGVAPGESVATFVRLGTKTPWLPSFFSNTATAFSNTATAVTTAASNEGILALAPVQAPLSAPAVGTLSGTK